MKNTKMNQAQPGYPKASPGEANEANVLPRWGRLLPSASHDQRDLKSHRRAASQLSRESGKNTFWSKHASLSQCGSWLRIPGQKTFLPPYAQRWQECISGKFRHHFAPATIQPLRLPSIAPPPSLQNCDPPVASTPQREAPPRFVQPKNLAPHFPQQLNETQAFGKRKTRRSERRGEVAKPTPGPWIFCTLFFSAMFSHKTGAINPTTCPV